VGPAPDVGPLLVPDAPRRAAPALDPCHLGWYDVSVVSGGASRAGRRFVDPWDVEVPFDGASPITWTLRASVLVERDGRVLVVRQPSA
jgi:hypothetical protein